MHNGFFLNHYAYFLSKTVMFTPKKKENKKLEKILFVLSPLDIYQKYLNQPIYLNSALLNTIRQEKTPSLFISKVGNTYLHHDFGNSFFSGNCFQLVQQIYKCSFDVALDKIITDFNLKLEDIKINPDVFELIQESKTEKKPIKEQVKLKFTYRKFNSKAHKYWNAYHLSEDFLKNKDVYFIKNFYKNDIKILLKNPEDNIAFAIYAKEIDKVKIYLPFNKTINKKGKKFYSDIPYRYMFSENININENSPIIVLKSRKDELVTSLFNYNTASVQSENIFCFTKENKDFLKKQNKKIYIGFGSDEQGQKEAELIMKELKYDSIQTPEEYLPEVNDFAEMIKIKGEKALENLYINTLKQDKNV